MIKLPGTLHKLASSFTALLIESHTAVRIIHDALWYYANDASSLFRNDVPKRHIVSERK